jgi:hypothetical protein
MKRTVYSSPQCELTGSLPMALIADSNADAGEIYPPFIPPFGDEENW